MKEKIQLTFLSGIKKGQSLTFDSKNQIMIGRDKKNTINLSGERNKAVSREHARITFFDQNFLLADTSTNGTFLNEVLINNDKAPLSDGDTLRFSNGGDEVQVSIIYENDSNPIPDDDSSIYRTTPSFTKIVPTANEGFTENIISQPFFLPGIITILTGIILFVILTTGVMEQKLSFFKIYQNILGLYLGAMMIFFFHAISQVKLPIWFLFAPAIMTIILLYLGLPFALLALVFRTPVIDSFMDSTSFVSLFIGHFVGAGLLEELFKAFPIAIMMVMSKNLESLNISGISKNRINPTVAILIGASSAVGFIVVETLGQYVPDVDDTSALAYGLMLLIPRFITGMAGHVGWAGIVAYYFALGFYYKKVNLFFPFMGWVFASILHGLWNSTVSYSPVIGAMVALSTFMIFIVYLFKSKISFPVNDRF